MPEVVLAHLDLALVELRDECSEVVPAVRLATSSARVWSTWGALHGMVDVVD